MISSKDRSGYFGASDTDKIIGNWKTATFEKWWLTKLGILHDEFQNDYLLAGTHYEHRILDALGIPIEKDKQIIIEDLKLRVNLDGNTEDTIKEVKTHKEDKPFKVSKKYANQVYVQMFASDFRKADVVAYPLTEKEYKNFLLPINKDKIKEFPVFYDADFIECTYLPRLEYLADCLQKGVFPDETRISF